MSWNPPENTSDQSWSPLAALAKLANVDINLTLWLSWLSTPVVVCFLLLPMLIMLFIYPSSSLFLYIHRSQRRLKRWLLQEAATDWDIAKAGREVLLALWNFLGWIWHGYEVVGLDNIPESGPALIVYYHGALPVDYYYLVSGFQPA